MKKLYCQMILGLSMAIFLVFGSIVLYIMKDRTDVHINYITPDPIHKVEEQVVTKDVYHQDAPIIPVHTDGLRELILLDKSGSMKDFVTDIYTANVKFFTTHDVWAFDTEVYFDVAVEQVEFGGDTDVFKAINLAIEHGYDTIWLCSDLESNSGSFEILESTQDVNIIVYSPKVLDTEKTDETVEALKACHTKIITMI